VLPEHNPLLIVVLGFLAAIVTGIGAGFIGEYLDPSFRTPGEVTEALNIPVLAAVPRRAA
jgi:capsular polysaccharide biosynthesis protein